LVVSRAPWEFTGVFEDKSVVRLALRRADVSEFVELTRGKINRDEETTATM